MTEADIRWIKNWKPKGVKMKDEDYIHDRNPIVGKLLKLKYRINDTYRNTNDDTLIDDTRADKKYLMKLISDIRHNSKKFTKLCKEDFDKCNGLWRRYE